MGTKICSVCQDPDKPLKSNNETGFHTKCRKLAGSSKRYDEPAVPGTRKARGPYKKTDVKAKTRGNGNPATVNRLLGPTEEVNYLAVLEDLRAKRTLIDGAIAGIEAIEAMKL